MSITEKQYNNLQLSYEQEPYEQQQTIVTGDDDANGSLQDWSGHENFFVSFKNSTGSEKYNREVEIDIAWAKIAQLSRERWSKENPY
jgi:hypothetical protein